MNQSSSNGDSGLHGSPIEDYALIGDRETAALISRGGSIDWLCWPSFSSGACFAALLGTRDHGFWKIAPAANGSDSSSSGANSRSNADIQCTRRYRPDTLIVETTFTTPTGTMVLTDFMPPRDQHSHVVRIVTCSDGQVDVRMDLAIRFDYGRTTPWVTSFTDKDDPYLRAIAGPDMVILRTHAPLEGEGMFTVSNFSLRAGESMTFSLTSASSLEDAPPPVDITAALEDTAAFWTEWMAVCTYDGPYREPVHRSLMTLKALTYRPSGGIVAAPTTSLPESIGGERNWDYRYCWLRDTSFTLLVLMQAGYKEEAIAWRLWLLRAIAGAPDQIQTIYGVCGERQLNEWSADWLPGYENSAPVHIGNAASSQFQLDVFGELAAALSRTPEAEEDIRLDATQLQARLVDHLCEVWQQPDEGIWETRGGREHFTHSKVMAWVALDRAIKHYEQHDGGGDVDRWRENRDLIHKEVCVKGFNTRLNSFVQFYGSDQLDASCLRLVLVGFLPPSDPRIIGTTEAIEKHLVENGLVLRYRPQASPDGLKGSEGVFLACSFWLVTSLYLIDRKEDAHALFQRLLGLANDVGLLSEEYDPKAGRMLGNFPQALSHIALVHAALALSDDWKPEPSAHQETHAAVGS